MQQTAVLSHFFLAGAFFIKGGPRGLRCWAQCARLPLLAWSPSGTLSISTASCHRQVHRSLKCCAKDTHEPPHHVVALRCATLSRPPRGASPTTASSLRAASPAWSRSSCCHATGCHFFGGEEFLCGQDHSGSENTYKHVFWSNSGCGAPTGVTSRCCASMRNVQKSVVF